METLSRTFWQRLTGSCATSIPANNEGWVYKEGTLNIDLTQLTELTQPGTALRFEGKDLPKRVLVVCGADGKYHAIHNKCTHMGRRLDFVPGTETVQCCSISKSTYTFDGKKIYGPRKVDVDSFPLSQEGNNLLIVVK